MSRKRKPIDMEKRGKFAQVLIEMGEMIAQGYIEELKMTPEEAKKASQMAVEKIKEFAGGSGLYIPKGHLFAVTEMHRLIYRRFNGDNHAQLAREFDRTERQIYTIVARCQLEEFERRQGKLF